MDNVMTEERKFSVFQWSAHDDRVLKQFGMINGVVAWLSGSALVSTNV